MHLEKAMHEMEEWFNSMKTNFNDENHVIFLNIKNH